LKRLKEEAWEAEERGEKKPSPEDPRTNWELIEALCPQTQPIHIRVIMDTLYELRYIQAAQTQRIGELEKTVQELKARLGDALSVPF
jgi:hypothetical protein